MLGLSLQLRVDPLTADDASLHTLQFDGSRDSGGRPAVVAVTYRNVRAFLEDLSANGDLRVVVLSPADSERVLQASHEHSQPLDFAQGAATSRQAFKTFLGRGERDAIPFIEAYKSAKTARNGVASLIEHYRPDHHHATFVLVLQTERAFEQLSDFAPKTATVSAISAASRQLEDQIAEAAVAKPDIRLLLLGETGVGKTHAARQLHARSDRADKPFVEVNCAAIPRDLLENELFGHNPGAHSEAKAMVDGRLKNAHGGTLFLDEIGEMPLEQQSKLLKFLDTGSFRRLGPGSEEDIQVDVRIIAATNRDLDDCVRCGTFHATLLRRLSNGIVIPVPPLRERADDLPLLVEQILRRRRGGARLNLTSFVLDGLKQYHWPQNVGELEGVVLLLADRADDPADAQADCLPEPLRSACLEARARQHFEKAHSMLWFGDNVIPAFREYCQATAWLFSSWSDDPARIERVQSFAEEQLQAIKEDNDGAQVEPLRRLLVLGRQALDLNVDPKARGLAILGGGFDAGDHTELEFFLRALAGMEGVLKAGGDPAFQQQVRSARVGQTAVTFVDRTAESQPELAALDYWEGLISEGIAPSATTIFARAALAEPPLLDPSTRFKYSNFGFGLLGLAIEAVTGEPYRDWIKREVVEAAKLTETEPDMPLPRGARYAAGHSGKLPLGRRVAIPGDNQTGALASATGFVSTVGDLASFFSRLDPAAKGAVLTAQSRREMLREQMRDPYASVPRAYGLGLMLHKVADWDCAGHGGAFQSCHSRTIVLPGRGLALSVASNAIDGLANVWADGIVHILRSFAVHGGPSASTRDWTGRWWRLWGTVDLVPQRDRVLVAVPGQANPFLDASELTVTGDGEAAITESGGYAGFGEPARLMWGKSGKPRELWLGGIRLVPEAKIKSEMKRRYES